MSATISQQIAGMEAFGAGNPMHRDDYRRPMRAAMLTEARRALLATRNAPATVVSSLGATPTADWPEVARAHFNFYPRAAR